MQSKRKFARAKDRKGRNKATVDVTNSPDTIGRMLNDPEVGSIEVAHQGGRKDAYVKIEGVCATSAVGTVTVSVDEKGSDH